MKIVIEFYRTRQQDDAHAILGHAVLEVADVDDAIEAARLVAQTLDMPQRPDAMTIADADGTTLYSGVIDVEAIPKKVDAMSDRSLQYGRRIEADRSWTIYHVFTGVPARIDSEVMVGLSRSDATRGMLHLNRRNATTGTSR